MSSQRQGESDPGPRKARSQVDHDLLRRLLQPARAGNAQAWEAIYRHTYPALYGFARRRLGADRDAEEAVAETMIKAFDRIEGFVWRNGGLMVWLYNLLGDVVADNQRASGRHTARRPGLDDAESPTNGPRGTETKQAELVGRSFARLDPSEQDVLELRVVGGLDADQVGIVLGQRPGAVRAAQSRALQKLEMIVKDATERG